MADVLSELLQNVEQNRIDWENVKTAMIDKGIDVPDGTPTSEYGEKILSIESGVDTSGDTVVPSALREGYTAHDAEGQEITGTIPDYVGGNTVEMTSPDGATLNTAGTYCDGNIEVVPKLQEKTVTENGVVTPDDGHAGLKSVDVNVELSLDVTNLCYFCAKAQRMDLLKKIDTSEITDFEGLFYKGNIIVTAPELDTSRGTTFQNMFFECRLLTTLPKYNTGDGEIFQFMFQNCTSLKIVPEFDTSKGTNFYCMFLGCSAMTTAPKLNTSNATTLGSMFGGCTSLTDVPTLDVTKCTNFTNMFSQCNALENLTIAGYIKANGFNVSWSPLSKASLISIVNALSDTTAGLTVTVRLSAVNTEFETSAGAADGSTSEEWTALIATKPNWTIKLINS